ncbi:hypothetical protein FRC01_009662, partial [Tulasnella sp. 417]
METTEEARQERLAAAHRKKKLSDERERATSGKSRRVALDIVHKLPHKPVSDDEDGDVFSHDG